MDLPPPAPLRSREGRSLGWRAGIASLGLALGACAWAIVACPWLLVWAVAAAFALAGLVLLASALLARGRAS